jgi:hypothetical protein
VGSDNGIKLEESELKRKALSCLLTLSLLMSLLA